MNIVKHFLIIASILGLSHAAWATPSTCPSADRLKSAELRMIQNVSGGAVVYQLGTFGTYDLWAFGIGPFVGMSSQEAKEKAQQLLSSLHGTPKPQLVPGLNGVWGCYYEVEGGLYHAAAVTPITNLMSLSTAVAAR